MTLDLKILGASGCLLVTLRIKPGIALKFKIGHERASAWGGILTQYAESAKRYKQELSR